MNSLLVPAPVPAITPPCHTNAKKYDSLFHIRLGCIALRYLFDPHNLKEMLKKVSPDTSAFDGYNKLFAFAWPSISLQYRSIERNIFYAE
jgi:hypothetical protein